MAPGQLNADKSWPLDRQSNGHHNPDQQQACRYAAPAQGREVIAMVLVSGPMHATRCAEHCQRNYYGGRDTRRLRKVQRDRYPGPWPCDGIDEREQAPPRPVGGIG